MSILIWETMWHACSHLICGEIYAKDEEIL